MPAEGVCGRHPDGPRVENLPSLRRSRLIDAACWAPAAGAGGAASWSVRTGPQRRGRSCPRARLLPGIHTRLVVQCQRDRGPAAQILGDHCAWLQTGVHVLKPRPALVSAPRPHFGVQRFASPGSPQPAGTGRQRDLGEQTEGRPVPQALGPQAGPLLGPADLLCSAAFTAWKTPLREGATSPASCRLLPPARSRMSSPSRGSAPAPRAWEPARPRPVPFCPSEPGHLQEEGEAWPAAWRG